LRDIMKTVDPANADKLFGGKVVLLSGDFRQVLPVVPRGGREQTVAASIRRWKQWRHVTCMRLKINMRVARLANDPEAAQEAQRYTRFARFPVVPNHIRD
jgi:PIF1-like helicase